jgi:uncharacterized membrane protein
MLAIEKSILVHAPAQTAYALWLDFERFPEFMEEVDWVRRIDETHLLWRVNFTGEPCEWETEVTVRIPHTRISWRSHSEFRSSGAVSFVDGEPGQTMITLGIIFVREASAWFQRRRETFPAPVWSAICSASKRWWRRELDDEIGKIAMHREQNVL